MVERAQFADERAERPAQLERPARPVAVPERHLARLARRRRHRHPLERDVLDPPRRRAEHERLPRPALVDHLLVELADPLAVGQEDAEQATVGDRPPGRDGEALGPVPRPHGVGDPVPDDPRPQLGELLARVATGEQVEGVAELLGGQVGEVGAPAHHRGELADGGLAAGRGVGDELLGEHVERVAEVVGALDRAVEHAPCDDGRLEEVAAVLRVDRAAAGLAHLVTGPPDALQPATDRAGGLDLDDEVDGAHVDAELEAARGDDRPQVAALELVLDDDPLLAGERAVVGLDELLAQAAGVGVDADAALLGELVELGGEALGLPAGVAEDDRRAVVEDLVEDLRVDARPDAHSARGEGDVRRSTPGLDGHDLLAEVGHVLDRDHDLDLHRLADAGVDDRHRTRLAGRGVAAEEAGDLLERTLRGRQPDALGRAGGDLLQPLERQRQVGAALGRGEGVDLVDDDGLDTGQGLGRRRGEHQVEALGRGDEQVGRPADQLLAVSRRGVAGAHRDLGRRHRLAEPLGGEGDPGQRRPQVLLDVERQRPQRRDVEDPGAAGPFVRRRRGDKRVDRGEEGGEGLPAPCRGADQGVLAGGDRRPSLRLGGRRLRERRAEPGPHGGRERREHRVIRDVVEASEGVSRRARAELCP